MLKKVLSAVLCAAMIITACGCSAENNDNSGVSDSGNNTSSENNVSSDSNSGSDNSSSSENGVTSVENNPEKEIEGNVNDVTLKDGDTYAVITIKDLGDITVKLFPDAAPKGVKTFVDLANSGFYEGKTFHRIIKDFMVQGGAATDEKDVEQFTIETNYNARHFYGAFCYANAMGKNSTQFYIVNEKNPVDLDSMSMSSLDNYITTYEGLAKGYEEGSQEYNYYMFTSQYYKTMKDFVSTASDEVKAKYKEVGGEPSLDGNYTVFGQTVDGFDVLDKLSEVEVEKIDVMDEVSKPVNEVIIEKVEIKTYKA